MRIALVSSLALLTACSQATAVSDADKVDIDCLASQTVAAITDTIREGTSAGVDPAELQAVPKTKIGEAAEQLKASYSGEMYEAYLENQVNYRLDKIQDALNNRDPDSEAHQIMTGTFELAKTCTFGS